MTTLTKLTLKSFIINSIMFALTFAGSYFGFHFFVKAVYYILTSMGIFVVISMHNEETLKKFISNDNTLEIRRTSKIYQIIDFIFDTAFLILFAYFNYKAIFVMWFIFMILNLSSYSIVQNYFEDNK